MTRDVRKGQNEAWFRDVNERLEDRAEQKGNDSTQFEIVCECAREECTDRISISFSDYESVRQGPTTFVVMPNHVDPSCELVVRSNARYEVVEKIGEAAEVAEHANPRNGG